MSYLQRVIGLGVAMVIVAVWSPRSDAAPRTGDDKTLEDLGGQLLDNAGLEGLLDSEPSSRESGADDQDTAPPLLPNVDELRRMLDPDRQSPPADGEDLGQRQESPLARISQQMDRASKLITARQAESDTRVVQEEIVSELDKLIEKLNKQCQSCSGQGSKSGKQQTQQSTPKPGSGKPSANESAQSSKATSQAPAGGGGEAQPGDVADNEVVKQVWGQLPERLRQQLLQSTADEFLPKYREELQLYFRRLAEEQSSEAETR